MMAQKKASQVSSGFKEIRSRMEERDDFIPDSAGLIPVLNALAAKNALEDERLKLQATLLTRRRLLIDLANTLPEADWLRRFQKHWEDTVFLEPEADLIKLSDQLRFIWIKPVIHFAERILDVWLAERPFTDGKNMGASPFVCSLGVGRLVPDEENVRAMLIQGVFENWRHFSICSNTECAAPYYIAKRRDQVVCDAEICKAEKQRAHALRWWHENRGTKG